MKTKLILIGVMSAVVVGGLWFFLLWKPAGNDLNQARADRAASEAEAQQLQVKLTHLKKLESNADILERDRQLFASAIPATDKLDEFIHQVNERAARSDVDFVSLTPSAVDATAATASADPSAGPPAIGLTMQVEGSYFSVLRFVQELREGPRLVTVESFSMARPSEGSPASASITGRMFMNPSATAAPVAPTASA